MQLPVQALALCALIAVSGCAGDIPRTSHLERELRVTLAEGAARPTIEAALAKHGIAYSYDRFANRYQGILRSKTSTWRAVSIYVQLDTEEKLSRLEVTDSYTGP